MTYRLPLSKSQKQYLQDLIEADLSGLRQYNYDLTMHGNEMVTDLSGAVEETDAAITRASGLLELLKILEDRR
jgi:hypothetical protein